MAKETLERAVPLTKQSEGLYELLAELLRKNELLRQQLAAAQRNETSWSGDRVFRRQ